MRLTFRGFLTRYCKELTSSSTTSLKKLFQMADSKYPRAYEPLLLLAICSKREGYLLKQAQNSPVLSAYSEFLAGWESSGKPLEEYLETLDEGDRFKRPLVAWHAEKGRLGNDREVLLKVSDALAALLKEKHMTPAQACRLANVNKGNFYAFLKGDASKLSRKTAMRVYRQLEGR